MCMANIQEKLLFFTKQRSSITTQLSSVQNNLLAATRENLEEQNSYNNKVQEFYYTYGAGAGEDYDIDAYQEAIVQLTNEHDFELAQVAAWQSQQESTKETLENQLNEITTYESSYQKLLGTCIKNEFSYGGTSSK